MSSINMAPHLNDLDDFENDADASDDTDDELLIESVDEVMAQIRIASSWVLVDTDEYTDINSEDDAASLTLVASMTPNDAEMLSNLPELIVETALKETEHQVISSNTDAEVHETSIDTATEGASTLKQIKGHRKEVIPISPNILFLETVQIRPTAEKALTVLCFIAASLFLLALYFSFGGTAMSSWQVDAQQATQANVINQVLPDGIAAIPPNGEISVIDSCHNLDAHPMAGSGANSNKEHVFELDNCVIRAKISLELGECTSEYIDRFTSAFDSIWNTRTSDQESSADHEDVHRADPPHSEPSTFEHLYDALTHVVGWNVNASLNSSEYENFATDDDIVRLFEDNVVWLTDIVYNSTSHMIDTTKHITEKAWSTIADATKAVIDAAQGKEDAEYSDDCYTELAQAAIDSVTDVWSAAKEALFLYSDGLQKELSLISGSIASAVQDANVQEQYIRTESSSDTVKDVQDDNLYNSLKDEDVAAVLSKRVKKTLKGTYKSILKVLSTKGTDGNSEPMNDRDNES